MSKIWIWMLISSLFICSIFMPSTVISTMMNAAKMGVTMSIEFVGIYAVWMGIMQVMDDCKLSHTLSCALSRPVRWIFGKTDTSANLYPSVLHEILLHNY